MTPNEILEGLNEEQYRAASTTEGAIRLIAGAGSGKTFTLTKRVAYICAKNNIDPSRVLSLTFTNKAAAEMRDRVAKVMNVSPDSLNMKTFHSLAVDIVKRDCKTVFGWSSFSIGKSSAHILVPQFFRKHPDLLASCTPEEEREIKKYIVGKVYNAINSDYYVEWLDKKTGRIPLATLAEVKDYMEKDKIASSANDAYKRAIKDGTSSKIQAKAEAYKAVALPHEKGHITPVGTWVRSIVQEGKRGICSFDDLVKCAKYMLENYPEIKDYWSNQFDYIQVDEFQDTDSTQLAIVQALYARHGNLFVVGDPDQSIYLFRGAEPTLFNNLGNYIPNLTTIFMKTNYRSTDEIVNVSNSVIELNRNRIPKTCESKVGTGSKVNVLFGNSDTPLSIVETATIKELIKNGVDCNDIAILYRNVTDKTVIDIQERLQAANIPVVTTLTVEAKYYTFALGLCKYHYTNDDTFLVEAAEVLDDSKNFNPPTVFVDLEDLKVLPLDESAIYDYLDKALQAFSKRDGKPLSAYQKFLDNSKYTKQDINRALTTWADLSDEDKKNLCNPMDLRDDENDMSGNGVHIITMHKSKGLEYPYVFVNGLSKEIMDNKMDTDATCDEQARLIYVAYSRAKKQLYMCCDAANDMHGTLGKVIGSKYVDQSTLKGLSDDLPKQSIADYLGRLDNKSKVVYIPLNYNDTLIGYRCSYSINGEKLAYQASLDDLTRLNCVPMEQRGIVKILDPIPVVQVQGNDFICNDELDNAVRRITLTQDDEIITVFGGSNKLYQLDVKDRGAMEALKNKYIKKSVPKKVTENQPTNKVQLKVEQPKPIEPSKQSKQSKQRVDIDYPTFIKYNQCKKGHKTRITDIQGIQNVALLEVDTKQTITTDMFTLIKYVQTGVMYLTNPSLLQNYGIWKEV